MERNIDELDAAELRIFVHELYENLRRAELAVIAQVNRNATARDSIVRMRTRLRSMTGTLDERTIELSSLKAQYKQTVEYYEAYIAGVLDAMYRIQLGIGRPVVEVGDLEAIENRTKELYKELVNTPESFYVPDYFRKIGEGEE